MYHVYILKSERDGKYYYGSTDNVETRLKSHNADKVKSTKGRRPLNLHYSETFETKSQAQARERFFKTIDGYIFLKQSNII